ncbi:MAG TPA: aminotransferase class III-fold pyridoxal phosphate-dependent enzyme [Anaerolineae bacterium]|nr:aminotransferase class III-fold pyridoxal phosphate-dependent enzyme [Anaerolineae bacterium]
MKPRDHSRLVAELSEAYERHSPKSASLNEEGKKYLIDGGSHSIRLTEPFPPRIASAHGAWLTDEDGHRILDFWQGHFANILGHNPPLVTSTLAQALEDGFGLQTGFPDRLQVEAAEVLCRQTGFERVRFTTSGSLATMNAVLLAQAFTGRDMVMKVGGGWHGGHPWGLKGIGFHVGEGNGFQHVDTAGLPPSITDRVIVTPFNDPERLRDDFREYGDRLACFTVEPFIGAGGFMPATREFLQTARELTHQYGVMLVFDEVIAGFRFRAGDLGRLYGVQADLATFGKIIGGGMPVSALAGREEIMRLVGRDGGSKVKFSGGTYSGHPASMLAAKTFMEYVVAHEGEIYPRLAALGDKARRSAEAAFTEEGIYARCTGYAGDVFPGGSLGSVTFPREEGRQIQTPHDVRDPALCDVALGEEVLQLALLVHDVYTKHGLGAVSAAHTDEDLDFLREAYRRVARLFKKHL